MSDGAILGVCIMYEGRTSRDETFADLWKAQTLDLAHLCDTSHQAIQQRTSVSQIKDENIFLVT